MPDEEIMPSVPRQLEFTRHDNFESWYANNIQFESSEWDLKMIFGELDLRGGKTVAQQHTAMTISWPQAKILAYFLQVHLAIWEKINGKIMVPVSVWPQKPAAPPTELVEQTPATQAAFQIIDKIYEEFIQTLRA